MADGDLFMNIKNKGWYRLTRMKLFDDILSPEPSEN